MEEVCKKPSSFRYQSLTPEGGRLLTAPPLTSCHCSFPYLCLMWPPRVCGISGLRTTSPASTMKARKSLFIALRKSTPSFLFGCWQPSLPPIPEVRDPTLGRVAYSKKSPTEICCFFKWFIFQIPFREAPQCPLN